MPVRRLTIIAVSTVMLTTLLGTATAAAAGHLELTAPARVSAGARVALRITVVNAPAGSSVTVTRRPYPFRAATTIATVAVNPNQTVAVTVHPDRSTRYLASLSGGARGDQALVRVHGRLLVKLRALTLGRAAVILIIFHPRDLRRAGPGCAGHSPGAPAVSSQSRGRARTGSRAESRSRAPSSHSRPAAIASEPACAFPRPAP